MSTLHKGDLIGWKFRAGLVLGHVNHMEGDKVVAKPMHYQGRMVSRHREKVLTRDQLDEGDIATAMKQGGHMARTKTHPKTEKAAKMGLNAPTQLMSEQEALKEKARRNRAYEEERSEASGGEEEEEEGASSSSAAADGAGGGSGRKKTSAGRKRKPVSSSSSGTEGASKAKKKAKRPSIK